MKPESGRGVYMKENKVKTKKFQMPHIYVILFILAATAAVASYIVPAGEFERVEGPNGRVMIDPSTYTKIEQTPVSIVDFITVFPRGLIAAAEVVFFTLIIGGFFKVLLKTGIIEIAVDKLTRKFSNKSLLLIPLLMVIFAAIATVIGTPELSLVYIPVLMPLMIALGYDSIVAAAIALCATSVGFTAGVLNPINTGLGQKIAGIPVFSGMGFRLVIFIVALTTVILYIIRYAKKVRNNPLQSLIYEEDSEKRKLYRNKDQTIEGKHLTARQKYASVAALIFFSILIYGVIGLGWFMVEMSGLFIIMGIVVGLIAGLTIIQICEGFNEGFRDVLFAAMIVGVARAVGVTLEDGHIMDTIVYGLGSVVGGLPTVLGVVGMYFIQTLLNLFIPSGSGQALVTMPIMAPLADMIGTTRQISVLAFQFGDGFSSLIFPTSGYFMAALAIAGVSYQKWLRFFFPLFLLLVSIAVVSLIVAHVIHWS